jgi:hypothetical protein
MILSYFNSIDPTPLIFYIIFMLQNTQKRKKKHNTIFFSPLMKKLLLKFEVCKGRRNKQWSIGKEFFF